MLKFTSVLAAAGFAMLPLASQAATPTLGDVLKASGISANGYVDFGSTWNNRGADFVAGIGGLQGAKNASFRLNQVGLAVTTATSEGFSGTLDLLAGQDAQAVAGDLNNATGGFVGSDIIFKQAYAQYTNGGFTVLGGRFVTLTGFEVINSSQNQNATRGLLFTVLQPLTHTGLRASYAFNKVVTLTGGINNAVGGAVSDNNPQKTLEAQVAVTPFDGFNNSLTFIRGIETAATAAVPNNKHAPFLLDLVSSLQVTKAISLGLNYDYAFNQPFAPTVTGFGAVLPAVIGGGSGFGSRSHGIASYASFQICNDLRLSGRAEYITTSFNQGALSAKDSRINQFEYTLTSDYAVAKNFSVLTDVRFDKQIGPNGYTPGTRIAGTTTTVGGFVPTNASNGGGNAMTSVTIKGIYRF